MVRRPARLLVVALGAMSACARPPAPTVVAQPREETAPAVAVTPSLPPQYLVSDGGPSDRALALGKSDGFGVLVDGNRVVVVGAHVRVAEETPKAQLRRAWRNPSWLGGGFLFASERELWASDTFDGKLRPIASLPAEIADLSFGPRFVLVRTRGERFAIDPRSGVRVAFEPRGVADVAALADGRVAALTELGGVLTSTNGGASWNDVSARLAPLGRASGVFATDDALWIEAENGAARVELGGTLSTFDAAPQVKPPLLRPRDPRWRSAEAPIRRALRLGLAVDDTTAVVIDAGSVARVHLLTGEVLSYAPGRLPPDATCEAVRAADDVVFACTRPGGAGAFVASHVLGDRPIVIEQTFTVQEGFVASDDGSLAIAGPCSRSGGASHAVCVRSAGGTWQEHDLDALAGDAGASAVPIVRRWIPRPDGSAWGLVTGSAPALIDARSGEVRPLKLDPTAIPSGAPRRAYRGRRYGRGDDSQVVDRSWSVTSAGTVRGWLDDGSSAELGTDGSVTISPFAFEQAQTGGAFAFARAQGKAWQTTDRGLSWVEVEPPASGAEVRFCSSLGCDLGRWYRVGWQPRSPSPPRANEPPAPPPLLSPPQLPRLSCRATATARAAALTRTSESPDDLGLGLARIPATGSGSTTYLRAAIGRIGPHPVHGTGDSDEEEETSPRALLSGVELDTSSSMVTVPAGGPRDPMTFHRPIAWVPPFDPTATVRRGGIGVAELVAAGRAVGLHSADLLAEDPTLPARAVPIAGGDPGDLLLSGVNGLLAIARPAGRVRAAIRPPPQEDVTLVSAAWVGDELAWLDVDGEAHGWVRKLQAGSVAELFEVPPSPSSDEYPIVADALAVGPRGELAILRSTSGDPPTEAAPMLLYQPGSPAQPLAPWSQLVLADADPACKTEGFRAVIATPRPWLDAGTDLQKRGGRALLRVRWSAARVCLEAVELEGARARVSVFTRDGDDGRADARTLDAQTWIVGRFVAPAGAARTAIGAGIEWRQPLACTLTR
jgi:hypothetical protein